MAVQVRNAAAPVILVGHSRGGLVIGEVAERVPDLLAGIIYVTALIVPPGYTALDVMRLAAGSAMPAMTPDGKALIIEPERAMLTMYQRCAMRDAGEFTAWLTPEPLAPNATASNVTLARWGQVPRAYIEATDDQTLSLDHQRIMQSQTPCDPVLTLDADHSPFLSATTELTAALVSIAACFESSRAKTEEYYDEHRPLIYDDRQHG